MEMWTSIWRKCTNCDTFKHYCPKLPPTERNAL